MKVAWEKDERQSSTEALVDVLISTQGRTDVHRQGRAAMHHQETDVQWLGKRIRLA